MLLWNEKLFKLEPKKPRIYFAFQKIENENNLKGSIFMKEKTLNED